MLSHLIVVLLDADDGRVIERWVFEPKVYSESTPSYVISIQITADRRKH